MARTIWYNSTDSVGSYGDWTRNLSCTRRQLETIFCDDIDALLEDYIEVDLDALPELADDEWEPLLTQWQIASRQRWTTVGEDFTILKEVLRRKAEEDEP